MLMQALVRTPDQHDPVTTRTPLLKSSLRTCLPVAGLQELATTPGNGKSRSGGCSRNLSAFVQPGVSDYCQSYSVRESQEKAGQCYRGSHNLGVISIKTGFERK